jgi:hypothetical protein
VVFSRNTNLSFLLYPLGEQGVGNNFFTLKELPESRGKQGFLEPHGQVRRGFCLAAGFDAQGESGSKSWAPIFLDFKRIIHYGV